MAVRGKGGRRAGLRRAAGGERERKCMGAGRVEVFARALGMGLVEAAYRGVESTHAAVRQVLHDVSL